MNPPTPVTMYLEGAHEPVCAIFHAPGEVAKATAVLLCPPFGWEEICSYRSRRDWAQRLAQAGYPSLRLSYPSTGDSGGMPRDPGRLEAWTASLSSASAWLREATGASRIVAIGLGLGGLLAYRAAALGAPIDDLVLWATPSRGRALVRQLNAFSKLEVSSFFEGQEPPPPLPPGELEAGGFVLSAETVETLGALDLPALPLPGAASRGVLLLERDGIAVDANLRESLERQDVKLTVAPGPGYGAMTSHPQQAQPPREVIEFVGQWLHELSIPGDGAAGALAPRAGASPSAEMESGDGVRVRESPFTIQESFGTISGILTEPFGPREPGLCAVFLNAGAVRRVGPSRMWVEAARRWAARGVPTLRLDVEAIGDADGDPTPYVDDGALYVPELVPQVLDAVDALQQRGLGERFVLAGLCAGAYWSFHAALEDARVSSAVMINPRALIWDPGLLPARDLRRLLSPGYWRKIRKQASRARVHALIGWLLVIAKRRVTHLAARSPMRPAAGTQIDDALERFHMSGKRMLMVFSDDEPLEQELVRSGRMARLQRWENVSVERIRVRDHTLRPSSSQAEAQAALDRALDRETRQGLNQSAVSE